MVTQRHPRIVSVQTRPATLGSILMAHGKMLMTVLKYNVQPRQVRNSDSINNSFLSVICTCILFRQKVYRLFESIKD